ncbi:MAG: GNAT family N-acetyltransferase, partial [Draconibacterium sp.]|nr:GNAT family N-acetyltransferase [Draconibacterium sp.]
KVKLETTYKGWLCEIDQQVVGFVIGDKSSGEIWVIAVLSEFINLRIGTKLLQLAEEWLIRAGNKTLWLTTDTNKKLRAYSFYQKNRWKEWKVENGLLYMQKKVL